MKKPRKFITPAMAAKLPEVVGLRDSLMESLAIDCKAFLCNKKGNPSRARALCAERAKLFSAMYDAGATFEEIALACGFHHSSVMSSLDRLTGVKT